MATSKYNDFSKRLIEAMKAAGYFHTRSRHGICMKTLSKISGSSEQVCRRYLRGEAMPEHEKMINLAEQLKVSAAWLQYGTGEEESEAVRAFSSLDEELLRRILGKSHELYREEFKNTEDFVDFVISLIQDMQHIHASKENLLKVIDLAISSITSYKEKWSKYLCTEKI